MAVRNFYVEADIDGRKGQLTGGPRSKDGGFHMTLYIRNKGKIEEAFTICGEAIGEESLSIVIKDSSGLEIRKESTR